MKGERKGHRERGRERHGDKGTEDRGTEREVEGLGERQAGGDADI